MRDVRAFLGFANFYREYIDDYKIVRLLTRLTSKEVPFIWSNIEAEAFEGLKRQFATEPILAIFDPELDTVLEPDGSGWALGSCFLQ